MSTVMWFRRDLRLADNPALLRACEDGGVLPLFVLDPALWGSSGSARQAYLAASLRDLASRIPLQVLYGDPVRQVLLAAQEVGATAVHLAADYGPYGHRRDADVEAALVEHDIEMVRTGSSYAVAPGRVTSGSGDPYKVYTPFSRAWAEHGWRAPAEAPETPTWLELESTVEIPDPTLPDDIELPEAGETAARARWADFLDRVEGYDDDRNSPGVEGTSRMSPHLKWGEVHPRTLLADLAPLRSTGAATYRKELAWRDFYADVLFARPETAREYLRPEYARMRYDDPDDDQSRLQAWRRGRTGYPIVDAGMRQLRATGWMHNRVRMIVASFLVKDLHIEWQHGAAHFMGWLVDGDLASNQHGWQWTAGSGTDASPFFRVFNPTSQGKKFDPGADYVRRWVPEIAELAELSVNADLHDPSPEDRTAVGYPSPIVDHAVERKEALARWEEIRK